MSKIYVGIDVGGKGGIFAMRENREVVLKEAVPMKKNEIQYDTLYSYFEFIKEASADISDIVVVIEDVHSLFGMSAKSNFNFGHIKGLKVGMLVGIGFEYHLVQPKVWQKGVWLPEDVVIDSSGKRDKKDTKATSLKAAQRIFTNVDFRKSARATIPHDGIIDGALMAEYARVVNL